MSKKRNHEADIRNRNKGTKGINTTNAKANGNRGKQLNPNSKAMADKEEPLFDGMGEIDGEAYYAFSGD